MLQANIVAVKIMYRPILFWYIYFYCAGIIITIEFLTNKDIAIG
jgi:hypothetical protein